MLVYSVLSLTISMYSSHLVIYPLIQVQASSGQYFCTIVFLFTLPIALRSIASTTLNTVGILYGAISCFSCVRRAWSSNGSVCSVSLDTRSWK